MIFVGNCDIMADNYRVRKDLTIMKKKAIPVIVVCLLIVIIGGVGLATHFIQKYMPSKDRMDLTEYYGTVNEGELVLVLGTEILQDRGILEGGCAYLPLSIVQNSLNQAFYWDGENTQVLYASPQELIAEPIGEAGSKVLLKNDNVYVSTDFVKEHTDAEITLYENPGRLVVEYQWENVELVTAKKSGYVRYQGGIKSGVLTEVEAGQQLRFMADLEDWYQVATEDGFIGYIESNKVSAPEVTTIDREGVSENYSYISRDYVMNLAWHQVTSELANEGLTDATAQVTGINVISPTWFSVVDNSGNISCIATTDYVETAHSMGWEVWGLIDNFNTEISTTAVLSSTGSRQNLIRQLMDYAIQYNLDGINIDFENLSEDAGPHFLQFLRELSIETHKNNIVLSVDNPVPEDFTSHYDRAEQGRVVDYVIIMGYDEHYVGSEAGPVASLPWVEKGIQDTLEEVPASRVINAIPFYTRVWRTTGALVESEAIGMADAQEVIRYNEVETYWDTEAGQNYGSYEDDYGNSCQIWLEDGAAVAEKAKLVPKYQLAGIAEWKLGFETPDVWEIISSNIQ